MTLNPRLELAVLVMIAVAMHAPILGLRHWDAVIYIACLVTALVLRLRWAIHTALLTCLLVVIALAPTLRESIGRMPVLPLLIPLLLSSLAVAAVPATRRTLRWLRLGRVDARAWGLVGFTGVLSAAALILWASWTENLGIGAQMIADFAQVPFAVLALLGIPLFALVNAFTEEAIFRGVMLTALTASSDSAWLAVVVQAAAFASLHYEMGFPNGAIGYGMALGYGLVLGYLRLRTDGLLAPTAAHVIADLTIGFILVALAAGGDGHSVHHPEWPLR
jgi:membrane protease YdiL (CAAX protease family)